MSTSLKLISSMATRDLLLELISLYQRDTALAVIAEAAGGVDVVKRLRAGEHADVVVLAADMIEQLIALGIVLAGSRVDLVTSGIWAAVKADAPAPDIGSETALKAAVLAAGSVSFSTGPSGRHLESVFQRWGILEQVRGRLVVPPPGVPVASLVARGEVAMGFQQLSELRSVPGIRVLGPLPPAIQSMTIFAGGITAKSAGVTAARALLDYLAAPAAAASKRRHGMDPVESDA